MGAMVGLVAFAVCVLLPLALASIPATWDQPESYGPWFREVWHPAEYRRSAILAVAHRRARRRARAGVQR